MKKTKTYLYKKSKKRAKKLFFVIDDIYLNKGKTRNRRMLKKRKNRKHKKM